MDFLKNRCSLSDIKVVSCIFSNFSLMGVVFFLFLQLKLGVFATTGSISGTEELNPSDNPLPTIEDVEEYKTVFSQYDKDKNKRDRRVNPFKNLRMRNLLSKRMKYDYGLVSFSDQDVFTYLWAPQFSLIISYDIDWSEKVLIVATQNRDGIKSSKLIPPFFSFWGRSSSLPRDVPSGWLFYNDKILMDFKFKLEFATRSNPINQLELNLFYFWD